MRILFINNDGGGFADYIEVPQGTTVQDLFGRQIQGGKPQDYLIRVNRQPAAKDQVLEEGNRVSMTPLKIEGAKPAPMHQGHLAAWSPHTSQRNHRRLPGHDPGSLLFL